MNILFTCAGRRNYLINYFKEALNGTGKVIAVDRQLTAPAMADADISIKVPDIYADDYITRLLEIVQEHQVKAIISLNDLELPILSMNKSFFDSIGTKVIISNPKVISIGFDKWKTYQFIKNLGLNTPKTYIDIDVALMDIDNGNLNFPLIVKPRWGSGSIGIDSPESIEEFKLSYKLQGIKLKKTSLYRFSKDNFKHAILIQEKLEGVEYGMDIVNDLNGNYYGSFAKEKLAMRAGETDKARSIVDNRFEDFGKKISLELKHIGNLDCDVFVIKDRLYLLEINPRFGGGYPFTHEAGLNLAAIYIEWLKNSNSKEITNYNKYKENIYFSKCDRLVEIPSKCLENCQINV